MKWTSAVEVDLDAAGKTLAYITVRNSFRQRAFDREVRSVYEEVEGAKKDKRI